MAEGRPHRALILGVPVPLLLLRLPLLVLVLLAHQAHQKLPPEVLLTPEAVGLLPPLPPQEPVPLVTQWVAVLPAKLADSLMVHRLPDPLRVRLPGPPEPDGLHLPQLRPRVAKSLLPPAHLLLTLVPVGLQQQELLQ